MEGMDIMIDNLSETLIKSFCVHPSDFCFLASRSSSSNDLAVLISRMQKNADRVEKDILETQTKLKQVNLGGLKPGLCHVQKIRGRGKSLK